MNSRIVKIAIVFSLTLFLLAGKGVSAYYFEPTYPYPTYQPTVLPPQTVYIQQPQQYYYPPCSINNFSSQANGSYGAMLYWTTSNCNSVSLSGVGSVALSDSRNVYPTYTTTYTLYASGQYGSDSRSVQVVVNSATQYPYYYQQPINTVSNQVVPATVTSVRPTNTENTTRVIVERVAAKKTTTQPVETVAPAPVTAEESTLSASAATALGNIPAGWYFWLLLIIIILLVVLVARTYKNSATYVHQYPTNPQTPPNSHDAHNVH